ncbi:MAG: helix-hairpin-helix domain-containing protein [Gammaproteobacteria bacterium]|nr:helix-hairpin-helix domain-containing protein [Gammaproteobacteria bacterium]
MKLVKSLIVIACLAFTSLNIYAKEVDINSATAEMMAKHLKGVGINKAKAIVMYRKKNGLFTKADDLKNVKGIGDKTLAENRENIILGKPKQDKK